MVKRQVTFTADEEVQDIIKESNIPDKKQSKWINDNIKKGLLYDKAPTQEETKEEKGVVNEVRVRLEA